MKKGSLIICFLLQALLVHPLLSQDRSVLLREYEAAFDRHLANPALYSKKVNSECRNFPEGSLFPYSLVALGFCHQIYRSPSRANSLLPKAGALLKMAVSSSARVVQPPGNDYTQLTSISRHGTIFSQLAMALSAYRLAGGKDAGLVKVENHLNGLLIAELKDLGGRPIESSPGETWSFDTSTALFAVELHDRVVGSSDVKPLLRNHHQWILAKGIDPSSHIPGSGVLAKGKLVSSRGCDLSWRLAFWSELNPEQSRQWYRGYHAQFWKCSTLAKGFKEWRSDKVRTVDLDSGPILKGVGATATTMGLCAALAHSDQATSKDLVAQATSLATARKSNDFVSKVKVKTVDSGLNKMGIATSRQYLTGFLFGDAAAFYAMSWHAYPRRAL